jgi:hypothetical protein
MKEVKLIDSTFSVQGENKTISLIDGNIVLSDKNSGEQVSIKTEDIPVITLKDWSSSTEGTIDLMINRVTEEKYEELKNSGQIKSDELYFTDKEGLDAEGFRIKNVLPPVETTDAATKGYVDEILNPVINSLDAEKVRSQDKDEELEAKISTLDSAISALDSEIEQEIQTIESELSKKVSPNTAVTFTKVNSNGDVQTKSPKGNTLTIGSSNVDNGIFSFAGGLNTGSLATERWRSELYRIDNPVRFNIRAFSKDANNYAAQWQMPAPDGSKDMTVMVQPASKTSLTKMDQEDISIVRERINQIIDVLKSIKAIN